MSIIDILAMATLSRYIFASDSAIPTLVPIGTVTGMLVAIAYGFFRDGARNDKRADLLHSAQLASKDDELDRCRADLAASRADGEAKVAAEQAHALALRKALYHRIAELELLIYNKVLTVDPEDQ